MMRLIKPSKGRLLTALVILSVLASLSGRRLSGRVRQLIQPILTPFGDPATYMTTTFERRLSGADRISLQDARRWYRENQELKLAMVRLQRRLSAMRDIHRFQDRHGELYSPSDDFPWNLIHARVIGADSLPYGQTRAVRVSPSDAAGVGRRVLTALTDRSTALPPRLSVVTASALVGRLSETGAFTARIRLITDRAFRTPAVVRRIVDPQQPRKITVTGAAAATTVLTAENNRPIEVEARGDGADGLIVGDVKSYHNVLPGDWLVSWSNDVFLPAEVAIGRVDAVRPQSNQPGFVELHITPLANLRALRNVYIVVPVGTESKRSAGR